MTERQQADVADQQVERAGEQREAQHLHQEHRIEPTNGADDDQRAIAIEADQHAPGWTERGVTAAERRPSSALLAEQARPA